MKHLWSKILALALALITLIVPCVSMADGAALPDIDTTDFAPYAEPVTLTVLSVDHSAYDRDSSIPGRTSYTDNAWIDAYLKYLNINVERIVAEDETALNSLINTMMASNELPDVIIASPEMYYTLQENEVLADLNAAYEDSLATLPYFKKVADTYTEEVRRHFSYEGQLLAFPYLQASLGGENVLWLRQDWLDAVGKAVPKTIDELVDVAKAFVDAKLGGDGTYGLGLWANSPAEFVNGYGAICGTWAEKDGAYVYADTQKELVSPALMRLQEMYKDGLLKADFATTTTLDDDVSNGFCGLVYGPTWYGATAINANYANDEKAVWIAAHLPSLTGEVLPCKSSEASLTTAVMVTQNCEYPEAIFKMMNLEVFTKVYDSDKVLWDSLVICPDGYEIWDLRTLRNLQPASVGLTQYEEARAIMYSVVSGEAKLEDIVFSDSTVQSLAEQGIKAKMGDRSQLGLLSVIEYGNLMCNQLYYMGGKLVLPYYGPVTENISLYEETLKDELSAAMCNVIMGADISEYENAVDAWYANGGQAITDDVNAYYASTK